MFPCDSGREKKGGEGGREGGEKREGGGRRGEVDLWTDMRRSDTTAHRSKLTTHVCTTRAAPTAHALRMWQRFACCQYCDGKMSTAVAPVLRLAHNGKEVTIDESARIAAWCAIQTGKATGPKEVHLILGLTDAHVAKKKSNGQSLTVANWHKLYEEYSWINWNGYEWILPLLDRQVVCKLCLGDSFCRIQCVPASCAAHENSQGHVKKVAAIVDNTARLQAGILSSMQHAARVHSDAKKRAYRSHYVVAHMTSLGISPYAQERLPVGLDRTAYPHLPRSEQSMNTGNARKPFGHSWQSMQLVAASLPSVMLVWRECFLLLRTWSERRAA